MKTTMLISITSLFALFTNFNLSAQVDSSYDWMQEFYKDNPNYDSIVIKAEAFFSDTAFQNGEHNYKDFLRFRAFWNGRIGVTTEDIENGDPKNFDAYAQGMLSRLGNPNNCSSSDPSNWEFLGPKSLPGGTVNAGAKGMGFINTVEVDYSDTTGNTIYAGGASGGLWKTTDQGANWTCISESSNIPILGVGDIAIDPNDSQTIYIATETARFRRGYGVGVLKTTDGGQSWSTAGLNFNISSGQLTRKIVTHPTNSGKLLALVRNMIYQSLDTGNTWVKRDSIQPRRDTINNVPYVFYRNWRDLAYHPTDTNIIYASSDDYNLDDSGAVFMRSMDGGATWSDLTTNISSSLIFSRIDISVTPQFPDRIYIACSRSRVSRIYRSLDRGNTWNYLGSTSLNFGGTTMQDFLVSYVDTNVMYLAGIGIAKTVNGCASFSQITSTNLGSNWVHADTRSLAMISASVGGANDEILSGNDGGMAISHNGGSTWSHISNNMSLSDFWSIDVDSDNKYLVGGMQDQGNIRYDVETEEWKNANVYADAGAIVISEKYNKIFSYIWSPSSSIYFSTNEGSTYYKGHAANRSGTFNRHKQTGFKFNEDIKGNIYASAYSVYKYEDTLSSSFPWLPFDTFPVFGHEMRALAISESDTNIMYAARNEPIWASCTTNTCLSGKIFKTTDGGSTWTDISNGMLALQWAGISDIAINPSDPDEVWIAHENTWQDHRVTYTNDGGQTWSNYSTGLPQYPTSTIKLLENSNKTLLLATDVGVFYRDTSMTSWECFSNNLPTTIIADLNVNQCSGTVYAAAHGRAIWKSPLPPLKITGPLNWTSKKTINSDIIVEGIFRIYDTLLMAAGKKIIVKEGGNLVVNGGVIMPSGCTDGMWGGIELWGDSTESQNGSNSVQPIAHIKNGGKILGAEVAIRSGYTDNNGNYVAGTSGGKVFAEEATFENNKVDVIMHPYQNFLPGSPSVLVKDKSYLRESQFISTDTLLDGTFTEVHISITGIDALDILGCEFENQLNQSDLTDRGTAIKTNNSSIVLSDYNNNSVDSSKITGFYLGVDASTTNSSYFPYIRKTEFVNNVKGVLITGSNTALVSESNFNLVDFDESYKPFGLYLNYCTGYFVSENNFKHAGSGTASNVVGTVIVNSQDYSNELYRNEFENLQVATLIHGDNRKDSTADGLEVLCNNYVTDAYHIALTELSTPPFGSVYPDIASTQGGNATQSDPAGNRFGTVYACTTEEDIYVDSTGSSFTYFHHTDSITTPYCRTTSKVTNVNTLFLYEDTAACPSQIGSSGPYNPGELQRVIGRLNNRIQGQKSSLMLNHEEEMALHFFVRKELSRDTIGLDTVIQVMSNIGTDNQLMFAIAALARKGDSSLLNKSYLKKLEGTSKDYLEIQNELKSASGKVFSQASSDVSHPLFMLTKVAAHQKNGDAIPANYNLPSKRLLFETIETNKAAINIYPNPADETLNLTLDGEGIFEVQLFDVKGSQVKSLTLKSEQRVQRISVADLISGIYLIRVSQNGNKLSSAKISIQH